MKAEEKPSLCKFSADASLLNFQTRAQRKHYVIPCSAHTASLDWKMFRGGEASGLPPRLSSRSSQHTTREGTCRLCVQVCSQLLCTAALARGYALIAAVCAKPSEGCEKRQVKPGCLAHRERDGQYIARYLLTAGESGRSPLCLHNGGHTGESTASPAASSHHPCGITAPCFIVADAAV